MECYINFILLIDFYLFYFLYLTFYFGITVDMVEVPVIQHLKMLKLIF